MTGVIKLSQQILTAMCVAACIVGCAGSPPPPDWQANATTSVDHAVMAYLSGDSAVEAQDFESARSNIARTGRPDLLARAELMRCAGHVASLEFEPCAGFELLKQDVAAPERAYADYLAARVLSADDVARLPAPQRSAAAAVAGRDAAAPSLQRIEDPLSRLIAAAVLFKAGKASPAMIATAVDTASAQG